MDNAFIHENNFRCDSSCKANFISNHHHRDIHLAMIFANFQDFTYHPKIDCEK